MHRTGHGCVLNPNKPHLSSRQAHWLEFFEEFPQLWTIEHLAGKLNKVADGLSRRPDHKPAETALSVIRHETKISCEHFVDDIKAALPNDPAASRILQHPQQHRNITVADALIYWKNKR